MGVGGGDRVGDEGDEAPPPSALRGKALKGLVGEGGRAATPLTRAQKSDEVLMSRVAWTLSLAFWLPYFGLRVFITLR